MNSTFHAFLLLQRESLRQKCSWLAVSEVAPNLLWIPDIFLIYHMNTAVYNIMSVLHSLPVSGWHVPWWWQLHGMHADRGPLAGSSRVNPGAHCSQNWPTKPGGQEQDSTHGAGGLAGSVETTAEVMVTPASCDVSGKEGKGGRGLGLSKKAKLKLLIQIFLWITDRWRSVCACVCVWWWEVSASC